MEEEGRQAGRRQTDMHELGGIKYHIVKLDAEVEAQVIKLLVGEALAHGIEQGFFFNAVNKPHSMCDQSSMRL